MSLELNGSLNESVVMSAGPYVITPTGTAYFERIGKSVTAHIPSFSGDSSGTTLGFGTIHTPFRPSAARTFFIKVTIGTSLYDCMTVINTDGNAVLYIHAGGVWNANAWPAGVRTIPSFSISYLI